jgi:carbon-monoxide dehydrogenase large subunit
MKLPEGVPDTLDVSHVHEAAPSAFPNGAHVAEVEIDPDTGWVEVVKYTMVNDFGTVINPLLVEGQSHGGVVQGIGQALFERTVYSEEGQPLTGSFTDYALPRAGHAVLPHLDYHSVRPRPTCWAPRAAARRAAPGALPSVMNAISDALGGKHINMPATPSGCGRLLS